MNDYPNDTILKQVGLVLEAVIVENTLQTGIETK